MYEQGNIMREKVNERKEYTREKVNEKGKYI